MKSRFAGAFSGAMFASLATAALIVPMQAAAQGKSEIRIAHVYSQDRPARGLRQADPDRPDDGPRLRDQRHDDGRRQEDRRHREGRPGQARRGQEPARHRLRRRQGRHRGRPVVFGRGAGAAAGGRGIQEDPAGRAGGRRFDHRRQVEQVHLPHRPQQLAGRDLQRGRARQGRRLDRHPGAGLRVRPRRHQGVQGLAEEGQDRPRGVPAGQHQRLHRRRPAHDRRAEGQARPQDHLFLSGPAPATRSRSPTWT